MCLVVCGGGDGRRGGGRGGEGVAPHDEHVGLWGGRAARAEEAQPRAGHRGPGSWQGGVGR